MSSATLVALIELLTLWKLAPDLGPVSPVTSAVAPSPARRSDILVVALLVAFGWQMSLASANLIIHKSVRSVETFRQCK